MADPNQKRIVTDLSKFQGQMVPASQMGQSVGQQYSPSPGSQQGQGQTYQPQPQPQQPSQQNQQQPRKAVTDLSKFNLTKYHKGGTVKKTGPALLRKGEHVLTKQQAKHVKKALSFFGD